MDGKKLRLLEHLIAKGDVEGMTILIPGLSLEEAQYYVDKNLEDYNARAERLKNGQSSSNEDLDIAHYQRMSELLNRDSSFEETKKNVR